MSIVKETLRQAERVRKTLLTAFNADHDERICDYTGYPWKVIKDHLHITTEESEGHEPGRYFTDERQSTCGEYTMFNLDYSSDLQIAVVVTNNMKESA